jgi:hypothetical protein
VSVFSVIGEGTVDAICRIEMRSNLPRDGVSLVGE